MFAKVTRSLANSTFNTSTARFASLRKSVLQVFNRQDLNDPHYRAATANPLYPLESHKVQYREAQAPQYEVTKLKNGVTVMTESQVFPNVVDLGILLDVGTRDETPETSGSLLSIRSTYYKTVLNTNETINYGMVQMSGGQFDMDYDQESTYFKAHCLAHDVVDIFNMVADCALEPRSIVAANAAADKVSHQHQLEAMLQTGVAFNDAILKTAYGLKGLGMPFYGLHGNYKYLSAHVLQKFQLENINPNRITVCAAGVESHQEFVELAESKLSFIPAVQGEVSNREAAEYTGGEFRNHTDSNQITVGLAFRSAPWRSGDVFALQVVNALLGQTTTATGEAGVIGRTTTNLLNKHSFIDSANGINFNFSDSGLFGLHVTGSASHASEILDLTAAELKRLTEKVPQDELQRAKNIAKTNILTALERQKDRLEEAAKNVKIFGKVVFQHYAEQIDQVTADQISSLVATILSHRPTIVLEGGEVNRIPSYDRVLNLTKL